MSDIDELEREVKALELRLDRIEREQREQEIRRLKWGVSALGMVVLGMGSWIWSQVSHLVSLNVGK